MCLHFYFIYHKFIFEEATVSLELNQNFRLMTATRQKKDQFFGRTDYPKLAQAYGLAFHFS